MENGIFKLPLRPLPLNVDGSSDDYPNFPKDRNRAHTWTREERKILLILKRWFVVEEGESSRELRAGEIRDLLCITFNHSLSTSPAEQIISRGGVSCQLWEMLKNNRESHLKHEVFSQAKYRDPFTLFGSEFATIYKAASQLDFTLVPRARENGVEAADLSSRNRFEKASNYGVIDLGELQNLRSGFHRAS